MRFVKIGDRYINVALIGHVHRTMNVYTNAPMGLTVVLLGGEREKVYINDLDEAERFLAALDAIGNVYIA